MFKKTIASIIAASALTSTVTYAETPTAAASDSIAKVVATLTENLTQRLPQLKIGSITPSPIAGVYEVETQNNGTIFSDTSGQFFVLGDLYTTKGKKVENLTQKKKDLATAKVVNSIPDEQKIVFKPEGETKGKITVFTDVDCGYCRKLHLEVPEMNKMGIEVSYIAFPRAGVGSNSYSKMVSSWCADDPKQAITDVKAGQSIQVANCDNPVEKQYHLAKQLGVSGTPAIILDSGQIVPGYVTADKLAKALEIM